MNRFSIAILLGFVVLQPNAQSQDTRSRIPTVPISIESGKISGVALDGDLTIFRGIPYAAAPIGELRWNLPMPHQGWEGVRKCDTFAKPSYQVRAADQSSEDCLYLNVWTKAKAGDKRPVMVWIHGGGLLSGDGSSQLYDGSNFAKKGTVFVSINYRLGAFGFMAHPALTAESKRKTSGNYGILDQIAALKWIQQNISAFGGDPNNVTIFGGASGATCVYVLVASPLTKGLFHRAILQSPVLDDKLFRHLSEPTYAGTSVESQSVEGIAALLGDNDKDVAAMRKLPAKEVFETCRGNYLIAVDGFVLPDFPHRIFAAGKQNRVPTIAGINRDEATGFIPLFGTKSVQEFEQNIKLRYGDQSQTILDHYSVNRDKDTRKAWVEDIATLWFVQPIRDYVRSMSKSGSKAWLYEFALPNLSQSYLGASHGSEIPFVFNHVPDRRNVGNNRKVANAMIDYWTNFAENGDPNQSPMQIWPAYTQADEQYLVLGRKLDVEVGLRSDACDVYDKVLGAMRKNDATTSPAK